MIRVEGHDGWLLITQQEHARLSYELASSWGNAATPPLVGSPTDRPLRYVREELLAAVLHHDDGWREWDASPGIDPEHGRPYDFTEMPRDASQAIWSKSIDACRAVGPLAGWVVAGHFVALKLNGEADAGWTAWLVEQERRREEWLKEWMSADPHHTERIAERCLSWLQIFDRLSLWFCREATRENCQALEVGDPDGGAGPYRFVAAETRGPQPESIIVSVDPQPLATDFLSLSAKGVWVEVDHYSSYEQLNRVAKPFSPQWRVEAAST